MKVHPLVYMALILVAIVCAVMANIAKYGWRNRKWTLVFAVGGSFSVLCLMVVVLS